MTTYYLPHKIALISKGRYDEAPAGADVYPGMALQRNTDGTVQANAGTSMRPLRVATEDALQGKTIAAKIGSGNACPFIYPASGDLILMLLQNGQNVAAQAKLRLAGDGTLVAALDGGLYRTTAASTNVTNTVTETTFSNGSYTIPANTLKAGDVIHIRGKATVTGQNSTNTHNVKIKIGSTVIASSTATSLAAGSVVEWDLFVTIRTAGASGTLVADGWVAAGVGGTATANTVTLTSTAIDTTATQAVTVTTTASAASASNIINLDSYQVDAGRTTGSDAVVTAAEAIDNSGGTGTSDFGLAAFIRVYIP